MDSSAGKTFGEEGRKREGEHSSDSAGSAGERMVEARSVVGLAEDGQHRLQ